MSATYITIFLMGLTGSLHCAGMCGPIVWMMPFQQFKGLQKYVAIGLYHFGRASAYAVMASILFSFKALFHPQIQQYLSIGLGASLLIAGLFSFFSIQGIGMKTPWGAWVKTSLGKVMQNMRLPTFLVTGFLNGLLPCGLVYMALAASMTFHEVLSVVKGMYLFGLGTIPMLVAITLLKTKVPMGFLRKMKNAVPIMLFVFGSILMLRGMNLGIPYLSPKLEMTQNEVKASCCHKP